MNQARLLLAEDHSAMRQKIVSMLEIEFDVVGAVGDGQALIDRELSLRPDVCVVDISMPVLGGLEAATVLHERGSNVKIIFLTGHPGPDFLQAALNAGANGYVLKPTMASELVFAINEALSGRLFISPSVQSH